MKLKIADELYEKKKYPKAVMFYDDLLTVYRGTANAEVMYFRLGNCYFMMGDHPTASFYFKLFTETYPLSSLAEECYFLNAECYYNESPLINLDQSNTRKGVEAYQLYLDKYPNSERVDLCNKRIDALNLKIQRKAYDNAMLYFKINDYKSSVWALTKYLEEYPEAEERELLQYLIAKSAYSLAINSVPEKQKERFEKTLETVELFNERFKTSKYKTEIAGFESEAKKFIYNTPKKS